MRNYFILFLFSALVGSGCYGVRQNRKFDCIINDQRKICAYSLAELKEYHNNKYNTLTSARERAMSELAKLLRVRIMNTVRDVLGGGKEEEFESETVVYTNQLLEFSEIYDFWHYPDKGSVTAVVCISKAEYQKRVEEDLRNKKTQVLTPLKEGLRFWNEGDVVEAFKRFCESKKRYKDLLNEILIIDDIDGDGKGEEIGGVISSHISRILSKMEILPESNRINFLPSGKIVTVPRVKVVYRFSRERSIPFRNIFLKAKFVTGSGFIAETPIVTGINGEAEIPVKWINPDVEEATLNVKLDVDRYGLDESPQAVISFSKEKLLGFSINYYIDNEKFPENYLADRIRRMMEEIGLKTEEFELSHIESEDVNKFDYLIVVKGEVKIYRIWDVYSSVATGSIYCYSVGERRTLYQVEGLRVEGRGATKLEAERNAFYNLSVVIEREIRNRLNELR